MLVISPHFYLDHGPKKSHSSLIFHMHLNLNKILIDSLESLTHYSPLIQPSFTWSKRNIGEICGLKFHYIAKKIIEIPPCAKKVLLLNLQFCAKILPSMK